ncbi:MAG TPA: biotin/lipoyl-binding protein [Vicinamibacterales bacterium]|jgi:multidrug resistance efflux pump|nr:biotin/lipoyl-binding protein [Vicinamibacterales bacterium]
MEILLLGIYSLIVWLVFIKFKWLPWTTPWKVAVVIFPIVAIAALLLLLNIVAPTTSDVRVIKYVVPIVSQVRGRVVSVPVENNRAVKKGDVLFEIDPTPYQNEVNSLEAQLGSAEAKVNADREKLSETQAKLTDAESSGRQLNEQLNEARNQVGSLTAQLELAKKRVVQNTALVADGAGNRFDLEQAQTNVDSLTAQIAAARASEQQVREKLQGTVRGDIASVAQVKAQVATALAQVKMSEADAGTIKAKLDNAKWDLSQTRTVSPGSGTMVNVWLRPGAFVGQVALSEQMTFVSNDYQIYALFSQNELHQIDPGNEAEITLDTYPGRIIKAHVDSILWAQSQGQMDASGNLPQTTFTPPPGKFPVKLVVADSDKDVFLAAGARGAAAVYTEHLTPVHIIRKVLLRVESYLDYVIIKHGISLGH